MTAHVTRRAFGLALAVILTATGLMLRAEPEQPVGSWRSIGAVADARTGAATVTLADGRTLIVGGTAADGLPTDSVVIYDPLANSFSAAGHLIAARVGHTATLLADGRVLVVGGMTGGVISSDIELFDPSSGSSSLVALMAQPRTGHAAARLADGTVLIAGGSTIDGAVLQSAELFDPAAGTVAALGSALQQPRTGASATTLIDGRVLLVGGSDGTIDLGTAEIFDPSSQSFTIVSTQLSAARSGHTAVLLPHNASVLIAGGTAAGASVTTADLFLPTGQFAATGPMTTARSGAVGGPAGDDGYAFVAGGGSADAEAYRFPTVKTDKDDYAPGTTVVITGRGFAAGENVKLTIEEVPHLDDHGPFTTVANENGEIYFDGFAVDDLDANLRFFLMATGESSGLTAQTTFTDANVNYNTTTTLNAISSPLTAGETAVAYSGNVSVSGSDPQVPNGAPIELRYWAGSACTGVGNSSLADNTQSTTGGNGSFAGTFTAPPSAGTYSYQASFADFAQGTPGNTQTWKKSDSTCQTITVSAKVDPTLTTTFHNASHTPVNSPVSLGATVHDSATVGGSGVTPTGTVDFTFYTSGDCTTGASASGSSVALVSGVADGSTSQGPLAPGSYSFKAHYSGDSNYNSKDSACEPLTVNKAQLTITTQIHNASDGNVGGGTHVALGSSVHDTATVTGGLTGFALPAISFTLNGNSIANGSAESGFSARSVATGALSAGSYVFTASVAGNDYYFGDTSDDEPLTVDKAQLTINTQIHNASHGNVGGATHVALGSSVHDTATVTGSVTGFAIPAITFTFNSNSIANASTESGFDATSAATGSLGAGSYVFTASVAGDDNYLGDTSDNEPLTVDPQQTTTTASVPTDTPQYSDKAKLRAVVGPDHVGPFEVTGTVYFFLGASGHTCEVTPPASGYVGSDGIAAADDGVAEIEYQLYTSSGDYPSGSYVLTACFYSSSTNFTNSGDNETFAINKEQATFASVTFNGSVPVSQNSFDVSVDVKELTVNGVEPDTNAGAMPGNIALVTGLTAKITGIATSSTYTGSCGSGSGGSADYTTARSFTCTFSGPFNVDAYTLTLDIPSTNQYWQATTFEDALSVWDPNAGFATGGGTINLDGDRVSFGFSYTLQKGKTVPRSGFVVVRHLAGGGVCRVKSNNQMNAPAVSGNTVTLSGKGNYTCSDAFGNTTASQGNITISAYAEDNATSGIGQDKFWVSNAADVSPTPNYLKMPSTASANAQVLTGGNVQVPQPQKK